MTDEQERGGAVQSVGHGALERVRKAMLDDAGVFFDCMPVRRSEFIRECELRDAAIRRAAIEECAEWLDDHDGEVDIYERETAGYICMGRESAGDALRRELLTTGGAGEMR